MTFADFIRSFHADKIIPAFGRKSHGDILRAELKEFRDEGETGLERYARSHGFRLQIDDSMWFRFLPQDSPADLKSWQVEKVPVERPSQAGE